jgi:hypothetical protein
VIRTEVELRFIVDITNPPNPGEQELLTSALELVEDYRVLRGSHATVDVKRIRAMLLGAPDSRPVAVPTQTTRREADLETIRLALERHHGNRTHAARELGVTIRTVRNHLARGRLRILAEPCPCGLTTRGAALPGGADALTLAGTA